MISNIQKLRKNLTYHDMNRNVLEFALCEQNCGPKTGECYGSASESQATGFSVLHHQQSSATV